VTSQTAAAAAADSLYCTLTLLVQSGSIGTTVRFCGLPKDNWLNAYKLTLYSTAAVAAANRSQKSSKSNGLEFSSVGSILINQTDVELNTCMILCADN